MVALGQGLDVAAVAEAILDKVVAHFAAAGVDLPERQVIAPGSPGEIAWDCEMLAVNLVSIGNGASPGGAGSGPSRLGAPLSTAGLRHAVFAVQLVRCEPSPTQGGKKPPTAAALRTAALRMMTDGGLLSQALVDLATDVAGGLPLGSLVTAGSADTVGPSGGFVGLVGSLTATVGTLA